MTFFRISLNIQLTGVSLENRSISGMFYLVGRFLLLYVKKPTRLLASGEKCIFPTSERVLAFYYQFHIIFTFSDDISVSSFLYFNMCSCSPCTPFCFIKRHFVLYIQQILILPLKRVIPSSAIWTESEVSTYFVSTYRTYFCFIITHIIPSFFNFITIIALKLVVLCI